MFLCRLSSWEKRTRQLLLQKQSPLLSPPSKHTLKRSRGARTHTTHTHTHIHSVMDTTYTSDCNHFRGCWHLPCKAVLGKLASFSPILLLLFKGAKQFQLCQLPCKPGDLLTFPCSNVTVYYLLSSVNNYHSASWVTWACKTCFTVKWDHILWSKGLLLVCASQNMALFQFWC